MSKKEDQANEPVYFNESFQLKVADGAKKAEGTFEGVGYSGKSIGRHGWLTNLIIDTSTLKFKKKVPIYRNHDDLKIAGNAKLAVVENEIIVKEGKFFESSEHADEIRNYAADGMDWEFSIGLRSDYKMRHLGESEKEVINGKVFKGPGTIFYDATVKEVSFVAVGADSSTSTQVYKEQGENKMETKVKELEAEIVKLKASKEGVVELSAEEYGEIALACSCAGGAKSSSKEVKAGANSMADKNKAMKDEIAALKKELKEFKKAGKQKELSEAAEGKIELSEEKSKELMEDEVKFSAFMSALELMPKATKKINPKFTEVTKVEPSKDAAELKSSDERKVAARLLVKEGKASNFSEAIGMIPETNYEV